MTYRFEHDPESGAIYLRLRAGEIAETVPLAEPGFGAAADVDAAGRVLGVEFLSFEEFAELVARSGGKLDLPERVEGAGTSPEPGRRPSGDDPDVLLRAMSNLEPAQQEVLHLRFMEGLTLTETAKRQGHSVLTTRALLASALSELRAILAKDAAWEEDQRSIEDALSTLRSA